MGGCGGRSVNWRSVHGQGVNGRCGRGVKRRGFFRASELKGYLPMVGVGGRGLGSVHGRGVHGRGVHERGVASANLLERVQVDPAASVAHHRRAATLADVDAGRLLPGVWGGNRGVSKGVSVGVGRGVNRV